MTPMMQQYQEAKERHPGMLLLFHLGDFYELFGDDAQLAHQVLGITLTSRDKTPMAGFPHHQLEAYLRKLLQAGHRVAICDQVEDPALAKGLVRREVTRIVTPGTVTEDSLLDPQQLNHLAALWADGDRIGAAWVELSLGQFHAADFSWERLRDELARLAPSEVVIAEKSDPGRLIATINAAASGLTLTTRPDWTFDRDSARAALLKHFGVATVGGFGFADDQPCLVAAGALLLYLQETLKADLVHLRRLHHYRAESYLFLDEVTRRSLELTRTLRDGGRDGSLLASLDRTKTSMGARLLQDWLLQPLTERSAIDARLDAVAELVAEHRLREDLREALNETFDLQRLTSRISTGRATPRDLAAVAKTLRVLPKLKAKLAARRAPFLAELEGRIELCSDLREALEGALVDEPPLVAKEGGVIRRGYHAELDELHQIAHGGKEWIANFQAEETRRTGIPSLKVGFNKVFGYYIEITHTHRDKVPADYQRRQTVKNAERYITPELKEYEEKVLGAEEKIHQLEYELFVALREQLAAQTSRLLQTADVLAVVDVLAALAELASARHYCRPELTDEPILDIRDGRHPVLDQTLPPGTFVPNDASLDPDGRVWVITGPNMSGKSVFIRQCALLTLLAQMGSFVPARQARIGIADRIFTRVGAGDELSRGQSTFMVEMTEAANILNNASDRSLVILDEIGRGTSTYDGVSLAWAIAEYLHDTVGCRALFATHYHELAQLAETLPALRNYNVLVKEGGDEILFLHKIAAGSANKSYGIHVAQLAGVPRPVLERAREVLGELESRHVHSKRRSDGATRKRRAPAPQPSLFADRDAKE
jgi:DNA mismatch repair protein MutS